ncbi:alpha/beta fold hydrolase [Facklamia sp. 7083-14-GEN3]|uniref:alpha/beta fold hydrolase n=1 Tax=Facklamia sp. 7083-14-GEN3 TaxID=2973478 RepID=UPI00215D399F|nr:alpha/beta hydrolase [Facklamia sp. 7083-14-GEN3]MCR8968486.1 alpha/beta hydrolase [Facklamia sp. 7083-14-GEN3]
MLEESIYFINGFGGRKEDSENFLKLLSDKGLKVNYLYLPGHGEAFNDNVGNKEDLINFYRDTVGEKPSIVIGHSIGGEIAAFLATHLSNITKVVLLDGGILSSEDLGVSLEDDLIKTKQILSSGNYKYMNVESSLNLLSLNHSIQLTITGKAYKTPTLLLLSDFKEVLPVKLKRSKRLNDNITMKIIENTSHSIYQDQPEKIANEIARWLETVNQ